MLSPIEKEIECADGSKKTFILSKFPALAGREIITQYPLTAMPKVGDYKSNESVMMKMMEYVGVPHPTDATVAPTMLKSAALIDNHVPDFECLMRLEAAMLEHNCSFFGNGRASTFFETITQKALALISKTLTDLSAQSSRQVKPVSTN